MTLARWRAEQFCGCSRELLESVQQAIASALNRQKIRKQRKYNSHSKQNLLQLEQYEVVSDFTQD